MLAWMLRAFGRLFKIPKNGKTYNITIGFDVKAAGPKR